MLWATCCYSNDAKTLEWGHFSYDFPAGRGSVKMAEFILVENSAFLTPPAASFWQFGGFRSGTLLLPPTPTAHTEEGFPPHRNAHTTPSIPGA